MRRGRGGKIRDGFTLPLVRMAFDLEAEDRLGPAMPGCLLGIPEPCGGIIQPLQEGNVLPPGKLCNDPLHNCPIRPGGDGQCLARAGGHFKQKARLAIAHSILKRRHRAQLVRTKKFQLRIFDEAVTLAGIVPTGIVPVVRILSYRNVISLDLFADQSGGVGLERVKVPQRIRRREPGYQDWVALLKVPKVMQFTVGQDDKPDIL